jgi:Arc/MetJ-type ribon-helix-helix transcriptional regulator
MEEIIMPVKTTKRNADRRIARNESAQKPARASKTTKVTFVLPAQLVQGVRAAVGAGAFESQNALARTAIERELKRVRDEEIARAMQDAANDPLFMADLEECMRDFAALDADANRFLDVEPEYEDDAPVTDGKKR